MKQRIINAVFAVAFVIGVSLITWGSVSIACAVERLADAQEPNIIVVHSNQSKTLLYNPLTHHEVRNETADGNVILTVQPKVKK